MLQPSSHQDGDKGAAAKLSATACGSPGYELSFEEVEEAGEAEKEIFTHPYVHSSAIHNSQNMGTT